MAVLAIPLEFTKHWFGVEWIDLSRLTIVVGVLALGATVARGRAKLRRPPGPLVVGVLAVLAVDLGSALTTGWPNATKQVGAAVFYTGFAFFVFQVLRSRQRFELAAACLLASGIGEAIVIFAQQVGNFYVVADKQLEGRRNGTFVDPNIATRVLLLGLVGALAQARRVRLPHLGWVLAAVVALTLALVPTFSRSGWLLAVFVALAWIVVARRDPRAWIGSAAIIIALTVAIVATPGALGRATDVPPVEAGPVGRTAIVASTAVPAADLRILADAEPSTPIDGLANALPLDRIRRYLLRAGVAMFIDHPITGVGVGGFQPMMLGPYADFIPLGYRSQPTTLAHTDVIRIAAEEGVVGLLAFGALLLGVVLAFRRALGGAGPFERLALLAVGLGLAVVTLAAQTEGRFYNEPYLWLLLGALAALATRGPDWSIIAGPVDRPGDAAVRMPDALQRALGIVGAALTLPLVAVLAAAVRLDTRGPAIYRALRVGEGGRRFACYKLRTMVWTPASSDSAKAGPEVTVADDSRVTRVGRFLRRTRLDELPQLWNVARGEMRLVGPRPEAPRFVDPSDPLHVVVFHAKPGITGLTQLAFTNEASLIDAHDPERSYREDVLPRKLALDADYLRRRSFRLDLWILGQTMRAAVGRGPSTAAIEARR